MTLRANVLSVSLHIFTLFVSLRNSFTFVFVLILLIFDLIMTLSERRRIFKLLTKMVLNFLNFSTLSQFFIVKLLNKSLLQILFYS